MPPRRKARQNSGKAAKTAAAAAAATAATAAKVAVNAANATIEAVATDTAVTAAVVQKKHVESTVTDPAASAAGTKRTNQFTASAAEAGPSKAAKIDKGAEVQRVTISQRSQKVQMGMKNLRIANEVSKKYVDDDAMKVGEMKETVETDEVKEMMEVVPAQEANHSKEGKTTKRARASKDTRVSKRSKTANDKKQGTVPKALKEEKPATKRRSHAKPIYEEVWREVYLAGTEWEQLRMVNTIDWEFDHLDDSLTEEKYGDKKVYLFGATEPQLLMRNEKDQKGEVIPVPVIVAIITDVAPPATVGLKSVQRAEEEIVPMSDLRMGWHPYAPDNVAFSARFKPNVYVLKCNERRARLKNMSEAATHRYDYVLPYIIKPDQVEDPNVNTNVQVLVELEGQSAPLMCEFDYELDDFKEFVEETIEENELDSEKHAEPLKTAIREAVKATKIKYKAERDERQKRIDAIPVEDREAMKNMKIVKFYPENEWPDVSKVKSTFVNRYYGHASEVL